LQLSLLPEAAPREQRPECVPATERGEDIIGDAQHVGSCLCVTRDGRLEVSN
jgi:hypothetical protein